MSLRDLLFRPDPDLGVDPGAVAVHTGDETCTWADLRDRAGDVACALADAGVRAGRAVGVMLPNGIDLVATLFGVWRADAVYVPLNPRLTAPEVDRILAKVPPAAIVTTLEHAARFPDHPVLVADPATSGGATGAGAPGHPLWRRTGPVVPAGPGGGSGPEGVARFHPAVALVQFTSGTTGEPKPVLLEHDGVLRLLDGVVSKLRGGRRPPRAGHGGPAASAGERDRAATTKLAGSGHAGSGSGDGRSAAGVVAGAGEGGVAVPEGRVGGGRTGSGPGGSAVGGIAGVGEGGVAVPEGRVGGGRTGSGPGGSAGGGIAGVGEGDGAVPQEPVGERRAAMANLVPVSLSLWAGIYNVLFAFLVGAPVVVMDRFATAELAALVRRHGIRSTVLPPAAMTALVDDETITDLAPLRIVRSITAPLSPLQAHRFKDRFGIAVLNSYGQTELGGEIVGWTAADAREHGDAKLGAVGRPHAGVELRIVDAGPADAGRGGTVPTGAGPDGGPVDASAGAGGSRSGGGGEPVGEAGRGHGPAGASAGVGGSRSGGGKAPVGEAGRGPGPAEVAAGVGRSGSGGVEAPAGGAGRGPGPIEVAAGESGELWVRTPAMAAGYADGSDLGDRLSPDGWFRTGDVGRVDGDGFLWIEGRVSDMVNRGGLKVHPGEVEEVLRLAPGVADAAVVGAPDERLGEVPWAFVVAAEGATPPDAEALATLCRDHLAPYKVPVRFETIDALPRNEVGKVLKRALVQEAAAR